MLIVEPPFHVSKTAFNETISKAVNAGFKLVNKSKIFFSKTALLGKKP